MNKDHPTSTVRVRFETRVIAPAGLPDFVYMASVLGHSTIQYTALIKVRDDEERAAPQVAVREYWPDAILISVERNVTGFQKDDALREKEVFGSYTHDVGERATLMSRCRSLFGVRDLKMFTPDD